MFAKIERYKGGFSEKPTQGETVRMIDGYLVYPADGECEGCGKKHENLRRFAGMIMCPVCIVEDISSDITEDDVPELRDTITDILNMGR